MHKLGATNQKRSPFNQRSAKVFELVQTGTGVLDGFAHAAIRIRLFLRWDGRTYQASAQAAELT